jgi:small subunit ribosomal protein S15
MITLPEDKQLIINEYAQHKGDTGSPEVQIALLSQKIQKLSDHLGENKKDNHSRRGLLKVIAKRRRIIGYLQKLDDVRYQAMITKLDLKK